MNNTKKFIDHWNREKQPPFELRMFQSTSRRNETAFPRLEIYPGALVT